MIDLPTLQVIGWVIVGASLLSFALTSGFDSGIGIYYRSLAAMTPNVASPSMLLDQPGMATRSG
ncbi:hypothetical protein [Piscirickettsia salmonis]|uniref:hypothetical protein n=1 Tax=Piscirickettsia salmonis TaxID=1238 RepID=UPI0012BA418A|nr:hypothetical protein Psal005_01278 [Piscirickettsia salmonis]QGP28943.1 hypothetical protein Psal160_01305 [Piscirickettsia salmonis]